MSAPSLLALVAHAAEDRALEHSAVRVLAWCMGHLTPDRFQRVKAEGLAALFGVRRETIGRALRALVARGYLIEGPRIGNVHTYRLPSGTPVPQLERAG